MALSGKCKGLVIKDLYLRRKSLILGGCVFLLVFILAASFCLSFRYGNLSRLDKYAADFDKGRVVKIFSYVLSAVALVSFVNNGYAPEDFKCKWRLLEMTFPLSPKAAALTRMGLILVFNLASYLVGILSACIIGALGQSGFARDTWENITFLALVFFMGVTVMSLLTLKYSDPQTALNSFAAVVLVIFVIAAGAFLFNIYRKGLLAELFSDSQQDRIIEEYILTPLGNIRSKLFPFVIPIYAVTAAGGYYLFLKLFSRRDG
ncbi:MAG: hypothetical protein NC078_02340 [Ruminococcus sp.]|nr:hypothetical protein [Ruminococcus sp.]